MSGYYYGGAGFLAVQGADGKVVAHIASPAASPIAPSQIIQIGDKRILLTPGTTALGKNALAGLANLAVAKGGYVVGTQQMRSAVSNVSCTLQLVCSSWGKTLHHELNVFRLQ